MLMAVLHMIISMEERLIMLLLLLEDANGNYQKLEILGVCPVYLGVSRFILPIVALTLIGNGEMVFLLTVLH